MPMHEAENQKLWTTNQLARRNAVSARTIRNWVKQGRLHIIKIGKTARFDPIKADAEIARFTINAAAGGGAE